MIHAHCTFKSKLIHFPGQLFQIAEELYDTSLDTRVLESSTDIPGTRSVMVKFRIDFDNRQYVSVYLKKDL